MPRRLVPFATAAVAALLTACAPAALAPAASSGVDRSAVDAQVRPQDDLFRHVNGRWLATTPIPDDKSSLSAFQTLHETTQLELRAIAEAAAQGRYASDADGARIGDLYASFMDEATLQARGVQPLADELAAIAAVADVRGLGALFARLDRIGVATPVGASVWQDRRDATRYIPNLSQGRLGLPDRDFYLQDTERFTTVRTAYAAYVARLLQLGGVVADTAAAARDAQAILALETALARAQWSRVENRDAVKTYNRYATADLQPLAPHFDWPGYLRGMGFAGRTDAVVVGQPGYFAGLDAQLAATPIGTWQRLLQVRLLHAFAPYLSQPFVDAHFAFNGTTLQGTPQNLPRWRRATALVNGSVGEGIGRLWVQQHFPAANQQRMEQLVGNLMAAYRGSIDGLDWMGPATKAEAQAKLAAFATKIGAPRSWIDYGALAIRRDDLVGNVVRARQFAHARDAAKLGQSVDRAEWFMPPQTVNAYYAPTLNEIVFPAAILRPPFFDAAADDAVNYGAIGAVIGHEISHGFDDQGSQYDGQGNLRDWWTAEDRARFNAKAKLLVQQYDRFEPVPGHRVNGQLSLGENIADNSGLAIAWKAYRLSLKGRPAPVIDGLTGEQRFFYGFAQVWRGKFREPALIERLKTGPHAPNEARANGTVRNHPGFYETFGVKAGDGMYLPPEERVNMW